jgi:ribosomal protein L37AE/L43A
MKICPLCSNEHIYSGHFLRRGGLNADYCAKCKLFHASGSYYFDESEQAHSQDQIERIAKLKVFL